MYSFKGRGATSNRDSRYAEISVEREPADVGPAPDTECLPETVKTIISHNQSPDIPFEQSINPYRGCEHGCVYCYARPTHAWLDLSPGLDFETRLRYKHNAAAVLERELRKPGYVCKPITIGANTDPYQPIEKEYRITRQVLEVLQRFRHPLAIISKGSLIERDLDILADMAADGLASVAISVTTLDGELKRRMEPRAASARARLHCIETLAAAGVPVSVLFAPVIPALNDADLEAILRLSAEAGASEAAYILLRLPLEISALFQEWLREHYPLRAEHVLSLVRQCRGGRDYDTRFGHRMRGTGIFAELLEQRFQLACRKYGLVRREQKTGNCSLFKPPPASGDQFDLF
ncbi:MAG: PA0069 family radical SAM protein [Gammaproteobacteria bacterium]|nr:PA0069 family radical SAM protein [Gammaproteobacteria bacterium]